MPNEEVLIAEVEGPKGTASIFEVTVSTGQAIEVEYAVVLGEVRKTFPSMGEAHLLADELTGVDEDE